jgi:hypothetical protein
MESKSRKSSNNKTKDDNYLFSTSLIFDENIDKLWLYLRNLSAESKNIDFLDEFKYIKGDNTWSPGNVFSIYWVGVSKIEIKCISTKVDRMRKKIKWRFKCDIGITYYKTLILFRITQSNKTLVKAIIERTEEKNNLIDSNQSFNYYASLQLQILEQQSKYLQKVKKDLISYGSCIVSQNYKKVWSYLNDFKTINALIPIKIKDIEFNGSINKEGSFIKFLYENENIKKSVYIKVVKYEISENKKTGLIRLDTIGTDIINMPKISEFKIIIINENKVQLSFNHIFPYNSEPYIFDQFKIKKLEGIKNIKKFLENNEELDINLQNNQSDPFKCK